MGCYDASLQIEVQTELDMEKKFHCFMPQNNAN